MYINESTINQTVIAAVACRQLPRLTRRNGRSLIVSTVSVKNEVNQVQLQEKKKHNFHLEGPLLLTETSEDYLLRWFAFATTHIPVFRGKLKLKRDTF
jgi:hypothetical protein